MISRESPSSFPKLKTETDVAALLDVSWPALRYYLYRMPKGDLYRTFAIRKRGGGPREIHSPCLRLKKIQGTLLRVLEQIYTPKPPVQGFTFDRSIVTNARRHIGARWLLNVDLHDFFPSIHVGRIIGLFQAWPFLADTEAATVLAQICTYQGKLPQGAPTSPIISNMVCFKMDGELLSLAKAHRCVYTRYADDITFSTRLHEIPLEVVESVGPPVVIGQKLLAILEKARFQINPEKVCVQGKTRRMVVTGLKINRFPNVRKSLISQVRAMLHAWEKFGIE